MYSTPFSITGNVGNNAFSYDARSRKELYVPSLKEIHSFDEIKLGKEVVFSDVDFDGVLQEYSGIENLYHMEWNGIPLFLFDNHNHAYFFWHWAREQKIIQDGAVVFHIDEHADTRSPSRFLNEKERGNLTKIFEYTNFELNVGNYIIPAQKDGLVGEVVQIRGEMQLQEYTQETKYRENAQSILNLDLDFFEPNLDYIDYELKKKVVLELATRAKLITVATSPYFIDQALALRVFQDIFRLP